MAISLAQILSAATPLVMSALDLYRRRHEATAEQPNADEPRTAAAQAQRLRELEQSDLEQSRLISELSRHVEALAQIVEAAREHAHRQEMLLRRLAAAVGILALGNLGLLTWLLLN